MSQTDRKQENNRLLTNTSWLLGVELAAKVSRLVTLLAAAYILTPVEYGIAMLSLASHDIIRALMRSGAGSQVIQCNNSQLEKFCQNAACIQWMLSIFLCVLQFNAAHLLANIYEQPQLTPLLQTMSLTYLLFPLVSVRVFLNQRSNDLKYFSWVNGVCIISENLSIAIMLYLDLGIMAFAYSKWVFAGLWLVLFMRLPITSYGLGIHWPTLLNLSKTSYQLLTTELLKTGRQHLDIFIAGKLLTPELFGLYSFAKSSGVGISQSISNAFNGALYPHMCKLNRQQILKQRSVSIYLMATAIGLLFIIQAALAPWYIPLFFSSEWQSAVPVVATLCIAAVGTIWADTHCNYLRAQGLFAIERNTRLLCILCLVIVLISMPISTPQEFANAFLIGSFVWLIPMWLMPTFIQSPKVTSN